MLRVELRTLGAALAAAFVATIVSTGRTQAGTDLSNVAWKQPVTGTSYGQPWYGRVFAENVNGYVEVKNADARAVVTNGLYGSTDWSYPNTDGGGAWIDLGAAFNVASIELIPKPGAWSQLDRATVYGSSEKTTDAEYSFIIPDRSSSDASHVQNVAWWGVRWIRVVDETDTMGGDLGDLTISEVRVMAPVTTYSSSSLKFIGGVTATATSSHSSSLTYSPSHLVNHNGMTDQHGPVGNTSAKSDANLGLWINANLGTGGYVNQAVTFDLGGNYSLDQMRIWNFNQATWSTSAYVDHTDRGVNAALIEYSQDGGATYVALADTNGGTEGNYTIPRAQRDTDGSPIQNSSQLAIALADLVADHIRLTVKTNYGDATYAGLSEVRFYGDAVFVPGDTNSDGAVDAEDAAALASYWGATVTAGDVTKGDFNNDGHVSAADASILAANWTTSGAAGEGAAGAVPEPSALVLLIAMAMAGSLRRRAR